MLSSRRPARLKITMNSQTTNRLIRILSSNPWSMVITSSITVNIPIFTALNTVKYRANENTRAPFEINKLNSRKIIRNSQKGNSKKYGTMANSSTLFPSTSRNTTRKNDNKVSSS